MMVGIIGRLRSDPYLDKFKKMRYKITPAQLAQLPIGSFIDIDQNGENLYRFNLVDVLDAVVNGWQDKIYHLSYIDPLRMVRIGLGLSFNSLTSRHPSQEIPKDEVFKAYYMAPNQEPQVVRSNNIELFHITYPDSVMEVSNWNEQLNQVPSPGIPEEKNE